MTDNLKMYTLQEVANILGVSRQTIYNYITAGKIKRPIKIGKEYRVTQETLDDILKNGIK